MPTASELDSAGPSAVSAARGDWGHEQGLRLGAGVSEQASPFESWPVWTS